MHKGHLIAASYGRGVGEKIKATFTYTNAVPQFGKFNQGQWLSYEKRLVTWGKNYCAFEGATNVRMHIVVGVLPSKSFDKKYFGSGGFSNYFGDKNYRVNVPKAMWTAACCTFQFEEDGTLKDGTHHTAFWRLNNPGKEPCIITMSLNKLFYPTTINVFPAAPNCYDTKAYVPLL